MRSKSLYVLELLLIGASLLTTACPGNHYYRPYDPYYNDYHRWDSHEEGYYRQWENETHREHRDFRDRRTDEQRQYYEWRHQHDDHDHDHK